MDRQRVSALMPKPGGITRTMFENGDTGDIISVILKADARFAHETKDLAPLFKRRTLQDTGEAIYEFIQDNIRYVKDPPGHEKVKSPARTWKDGYGDCKSMSIMAGSILYNLGIPYAYRFVSFDPSRQVTHVYIVAGRGKRIVIDPVHDTFNKEVQYTYKKDMTRISMIHGLNGRQRIGESQASITVPKRKYIPFASLSQGETLAHVLDRRAAILQANDPGNLTYQLAKQLSDDIIGEGVHSMAARRILQKGQGAGMGRFTQLLRKSIRNYRRLGQKTKGSRSISGSDLQGRCISLVAERHGIDVFDVVKDLDKFVNKYSDEIEECIRHKTYEPLINDRFEMAGYTLLYDFVSTAEANSVGGLFAAKKLQHSLVIGSMANLSGLDRQTVQLMAENGILANGIRKDALFTYLNFKNQSLAKLYTDGIGELVTIIGAITAAIVALVQLIGGIAPQDKVLSGFPPQFGEGIKPESNDFESLMAGGSPGSPTTQQGILPLALLGGAFVLGT